MPFSLVLSVFISYQIMTRGEGVPKTKKNLVNLSGFLYKEIIGNPLRCKRSLELQIANREQCYNGK